MRQGFSLVELSIVLVILGLLVGGVLTGQSLIRAAELRSVSTEFSKYQAAVNTFRDKYFQLPGDMNNATSFWGKDNVNCAGHTGTAATPGTCNGNGDGNIASPAAASATGETFQFWKHLQLSGLIEGSYTGLAGAGDLNHHILGTNAPRSKIANGGWGVLWLGTYVGDTDNYALDYGNLIMIGAQTANYLPASMLFKPEEAWNIDTKMDDGKPARGKIIARYWNNACAAADDGTHANNDLAASYKLSDTSVQCSLYFIKAF